MSCNIVILQSFSRILFCAMWYFFALISIMYDFVLSWSSYIFFLCLDRYIRAIAIDRRKRETEILARISDKKYCSLSYNLLTIPLEFPYFQALRKNKNGFRTRTFIEERSTSKYFFNRFPVLVLFIPFYFILFEKFQHNFFEFFYWWVSPSKCLRTQKSNRWLSWSIFYMLHYPKSLLLHLGHFENFKKKVSVLKWFKRVQEKMFRKREIDISFTKSVLRRKIELRDKNDSNSYSIMSNKDNLVLNSAIVCMEVLFYRYWR